MYSLIVTCSAGEWDGKRSTLTLSRLGEYTTEALKVRYRALDERSIEELKSLPALFAYEEENELPARVGHVTRIFQSSGSIRFEFKIIDEIPPIQPEQLSEIAWDLDINDWEMRRTHWAVKNVDLFGVLREAGLLEAGKIPRKFTMMQNHFGSDTQDQLLITPTVFAVPRLERDPTLVSVMMPFSREFDVVYATIQSACQGAGLRCERADDVWEESTIIQDIFNLIFRSAVVVVDLTGRNSNVLYETGIAHTLGRPVVPISRAVDTLPFDLAHHRTLAYLPNDQGLAEMRVKLERRLRV